MWRASYSSRVPVSGPPPSSSWARRSRSSTPARLLSSLSPSPRRCQSTPSPSIDLPEGHHGHNHRRRANPGGRVGGLGRSAPSPEAGEWSRSPARCGCHGNPSSKRGAMSSPGARRALAPWWAVGPLVLAGLLLCLLAGPAWAGPWVDRTAGHLRDDPLYVHPAARPTLSQPDQEEIRARLALVGTPIFVAVLPGQALAEAGGNANRLAALVAASVRRPGTYLVVAGGEEGGGSNTLARGEAAGLARTAFRRNPDLAAATMDYIARVEDAAGTPPATAPPAQPPPGQEDTDGDTVLT